MNPPCLSERQIEKLTAIKDFLQNNLNKRYTPDQLAKAHSISTRFLQKNFKLLFNQHIYEFIKEQRMKKAAQLIITEDYTEKAIADKLGIQLTTLCSMFKRYHGVTISQYKKLHQ